MTNTIPHLFIGVDPGASGIKVIGSLEGDAKFTSALIDSHCCELDVLPIPNPKFDENSLWVTVGGTHYAVGNLAAIKLDDQFDVAAGKIDSIVPKLCAAVALMYRQLRLPAKFKLSLVSVLPPGEHSHSEEMRTGLRKALGTLITPIGRIKPILHTLEIHPEGFGILNWHSTKGIARERNISAIMCGFRNTSILSTRKTQIKSFRTSDYGFYSLLAKIPPRAGANYSLEALSEPVYNYLMNSDTSGLRSLCQSDNPDIEISKIIKAIDVSASEYIHALKVWLNNNLSKDKKVIVLCGGNAEYLKKHLYDSLVSNTEILCDRPAFYENIPDIHFPELMKIGTPYRFLDIYMLWKMLAGVE